MIRSFSTILVLISLIAASLLPVTAQQDASRTEPENAVPSDRPDLKVVVSQADKKFREESAAFDPKEAEKSQFKQQAKAGWTKKEKTAIAFLAVGIAVLVFVLVKYGKDCIRSSPAGCTPGVDEFCTCQEYAQN